MPIAARLVSLLRWIKRNPAYSLLGVIASVAGAIAGLPAAWHAATLILGIPECGKYSDIYYYYNGHFKNNHDEKNQGEKWTEYQKTTTFSFKELDRTRDYIVLLNLTPRQDPRWQSMLVRLPACGGTAQWTYENPEQWIDLFQVSTKVAPSEALEQAKLEKR
jgi:hypothetical protein